MVDVGLKQMHSIKYELSSRNTVVKKPDKSLPSRAYSLIEETYTKNDIHNIYDYKLWSILWKKYWVFL